MARIKILHIVHSLAVGGLENGLVNLLNRLDPERFEHVVCCLTKSGSFAERLNSDVKIFELGLSAGKFRFPLFRLARLFRDIAPDIAHSRGWATIDATFAARLARVPAIIHGEHGRDLADKDGDNWKRNQIRRLIGLNVKRYVVVCEFFRSWLMQSCGVRAEKILHIPNGVDTDKFNPKLAVRTGDDLLSDAEWRRQFKIPANAVVIGSIGRLDPVKDFPTLLKGFAEITGRYSDTVLVIVGDGALRAELARMANDLGVNPSLRWLGERRDIPDLLRRFDLFVQTSIFEGMSNTILEAMASGRAVVATITGGNAELVRDGENGTLIPVSDPDALALVLDRYLRDAALRAKHGAAGRRIAENEFALAKMAARYGELYESLGSGRPS